MFSLIDVLSQYEAGTTQVRGQTDRMVRFMHGHMDYDEFASFVAIKMWRHKLMHTAQPRPLIGSSGKRYRWLLHWWGELPQEQHMQFQNEPILNVGLMWLLDDLRESAARFFDAVSRSVEMQERLHTAHSEMETPEEIPD